MTITHEENRRRFCLYDDDGQRMGLIEYMKAENGQLYATHTEVAPQYEGQGCAAKLLDALAAYARESKATIVPVCSYVKHAFRKSPEKYADVMAEK